MSDRFRARFTAAVVAVLVALGIMYLPPAQAQFKTHAQPSSFRIP